MQQGTQRTALSWGQRVRTGISGRGNTMNEDEVGSSTDRREMNRCLIQLQYKVLGGERRLQGGEDMLRDLKFILEAKGNCSRF